MEKNEFNLLSLKRKKKKKQLPTVHYFPEKRLLRMLSSIKHLPKG